MPLLSVVGTSRLPYQQGGKRRNKSLLFIKRLWDSIFLSLAKVSWSEFAVLDDENLAIPSAWEQTPAKHSPVQVKNMSSWSIQPQWAALQSHLLEFCWRPGCLHLPHGLWFLLPTGKASPLLTCWQCSASCSPGTCWPLLQESTVRTWSIWCSPATPGPLLTIWFLSSQPSCLFLFRWDTLNFLRLEIFLPLPSYTLNY